MDSTFPSAIPEIPVTDLAAATAYYRDSLGFTVDWRDDALGLTGLSRGHCRLFLAAEQYRRARGNAGPTLTWLNLGDKEAVDELYRAWSAGKARVVSVPRSEPWGLHEFTAADLDGNLFRVFYDFATPECAGEQ
jgi:catechol 2,3-dioxygenase-like lactoylglutathione lyase family enzyme